MMILEKSLQAGFRKIKELKNLSLILWMVHPIIVYYIIEVERKVGVKQKI